MEDPDFITSSLKQLMDSCKRLVKRNWIESILRFSEGQHFYNTKVIFKYISRSTTAIMLMMSFWTQLELRLWIYKKQYANFLWSSDLDPLFPISDIRYCLFWCVSIIYSKIWFLFFWKQDRFSISFEPLQRSSSRSESKHEMYIY